MLGINGKMLKTAGFMAAATLLAKICGLVRDMLIAAYFATGYQGEAYVTATKLPTMLFDIVIGGVISASFIPVFNSILEKKDKKEALQFANKFIGMVLTITILISVFGIIFSGPLIGFLAPDFDAQTHNLASELSGIMFPMIIFTGLAFSFVGILQSFGEFNIPAVMSLVSNLAVIAYFPVFGKRFGVHGLAVTMLVAWSLQVFIQIPALKRFEFRFRPSLRLRDENIKAALLLAGPMLVSTWVQPLYSIVNTRIASGMAGSVAMLEYANRLYTVMVGVFSFVVTNLIFPKLSRANASQNREETDSLIIISLRTIAVVILPLMAGFIILGRPIISIIYERGNFTPEDARLTGIALSCYSVGMIGFSVNEVLSKAFFSMQNSKTPMINAVISMCGNILLAYTLSELWGLGGLALAAAGGSTINAVLNYACMRKQRGRFLSRADVLDFVKIIISAIVMAGVVLLIRWLLQSRLQPGFTGNLVLCLVCGAAGAAVYGVCGYLIGVEEIRSIFKGGAKLEK